MLNFANRFGDAGAASSNSGAPAAGQTGTRRDLPKASVWVNLGAIVTVLVQVEGSEETREEQRFIPIPVGIPLDTMEPITINTRNVEYGQFQSARNDVLAQLKAAGENLKPGEEKIICFDGNTGLAVQMRRVNDAAQVPAADESNPFAVKLAL